jgi:hypothetical protein
VSNLPADNLHLTQATQGPLLAAQTNPVSTSHCPLHCCSLLGQSLTERIVTTAPPPSLPSMLMFHWTRLDNSTTTHTSTTELTGSTTTISTCFYRSSPISKPTLANHPLQPHHQWTQDTLKLIYYHSTTSESTLYSLIDWQSKQPDPSVQDQFKTTRLRRLTPR